MLKRISSLQVGLIGLNIRELFLRPIETPAFRGRKKGLFPDALINEIVLIQLISERFSLWVRNERLRRTKGLEYRSACLFYQNVERMTFGVPSGWKFNCTNQTLVLKAFIGPSG